MTVLWHRLGTDHPLVRALDRVSRAQNRNVSVRKRVLQSKDSTPDVLARNEAERAELARERTEIEAEVLHELTQLTRSSIKSDAARTARRHLASALAQRHRIASNRQDASVG